MSGLEPMYGLGSLFVLLFSIALAIVTCLIPFFILRIRNEAIKSNQKLDTIIELLRRPR